MTLSNNEMKLTKPAKARMARPSQLISGWSQVNDATSRS